MSENGKSNGHGDVDTRFNSRTLYDGNDRAGARSMVKEMGFTDEDLQKPIIGIANTWIETMPCNYNLRALAEHVKQGVREAGGTPREFNTVAISDGYLGPYLIPFLALSFVLLAAAVGAIVLARKD